MREILLTQGYVALVDDEDFEQVSSFAWFAQRIGRRVYAARHRQKGETGPKYVYLHRFLLPESKTVDHIDGDGLNNRRNNLRPATHRQNCQAFKLKRKETHSQFRGVTWCERAGKWKAQLKTGGINTNIGYFLHEVEAAKAYDSLAVKVFGAFASLNLKLS